jgi:pimeloyl-ACP methyl ester carboxylesterase/predicted glycosyltransferase
MRARLPDRDGFIERDGVRTFFEVFGSGERTLLLLPAWSVVHSRMWKMQVPYLARHYRVVTFDGRGNGRSDRPAGPAAYEADEYARDALAVLDETATPTAVMVGLSLGAAYMLRLLALAPERVDGQVFICPTTQLSPFSAERAPHAARFEEHLDSWPGWAKENAEFWREHYVEFLTFFFGSAFPEAHSTKQVEDAVGWGRETTPQTLTDTRRGATGQPLVDLAALPRDVPTLVVQGTRDAVVGPDAGALLADALGPQARLVTLDGSGHVPTARDPVRVNLLVREFVDSLPGPGPGRTLAAPAVRRWTRGRSRARRVLYVSSPIGLGHVRRDLAIADRLREVHPDVQIDWLAQHPVTQVLSGRGERVHPASSALASESGHVEDECGEHDLHVFQAWRRMDEILCANFMVFHDLVREADVYDMWVADEAWELDYYLHENPELKRAAYVWMTDFVGWLPMPDGGAAEARLTADYNLEMIEHIARFPRVRDRAIFVGAPDDVVPDEFGPGLPPIREWTCEHYDFTGDYITGMGSLDDTGRAALRAELGYAPHETVCVVTVGGSGVGGHLLAKVVAAYPEARDLLPGLRMVAVAGPRIDPSTVVAPPGVEVRGYVPDLQRHLSVCDVAVVQGGLTTTMELTAAGRPFVYFPLAHHFEQNLHVPHRLDRHGAGRRMDYASATPGSIAQAIAQEVGRTVAYRPIGTAGVDRAATRIAELL